MGKEKIPYCQRNSDCCGTCKYCGSYRCDCSGYASWTVGFPAGTTTFDMAKHCDKIEKKEMQHGDIWLNTQEHVVIFAGWVNKSNIEAGWYCYQESGCHS